MAKLQIKFSTTEIGTAIDYYSQGEWRCLKLLTGELNQEKVRQEFAINAAKHNIPYSEVRV